MLFIPKTPKGNCLGNAVMKNYFGMLNQNYYIIMEFKDTNHLKKETKDSTMKE